MSCSFLLFINPFRLAQLWKRKTQTTLSLSLRTSVRPAGPLNSHHCPPLGTFSGNHSHLARVSILLGHHYNTLEKTQDLNEIDTIISRLDALCRPSSLRASIKTEGSKSFNREKPSAFFPKNKMYLFTVSAWKPLVWNTLIIMHGCVYKQKLSIGETVFNFQ